MPNATVSLIFGVFGWIKFRKSSFNASAARYNEKALDVDLSGKTVIVTGANSGLGFEVALALARRKAEVMLVVRNEERGKEAIERITRETESHTVFLETCDLSSPSQVKEFCYRFLATHNRIDILVNNAGALLNEYSETEDGLEASFAANVLGTYIFTKLLLPALEPGSRVITVSSGGMLTSPLGCLSDLQMPRKSYNGVVAYSRQKARFSLLIYSVFRLNFRSTGPNYIRCPSSTLCIQDGIFLSPPNL